MVDKKDGTEICVEPGLHNDIEWPAPQLKTVTNTSVATPEELAYRLQHRTACYIQNGQQGAPKWQTGSGKGNNPKFLGTPGAPSMRKRCNGDMEGEKQGEGKKKERQKMWSLMSLLIDCLTATDFNADRSCQKFVLVVLGSKGLL